MCVLSMRCLGLSVTDEILQGKAEWPKLFEPPNFFSKYKYVSWESVPTICLQHFFHPECHKVGSIFLAIVSDFIHLLSIGITLC